MASSPINLLDPGLGIQNIMDPGTAGHLPDARPLASSAMREAGLDELYNSRKAFVRDELAPLLENTELLRAYTGLMVGG